MSKLATLTHTKHTYMWIKSKSTTSSNFPMKKAIPVTQNALYSCFALFVADLYSVDAFCCIQEVVLLLIKERRKIAYLVFLIQFSI
jgi:hypothetical protein